MSKTTDKSTETAEFPASIPAIATDQFQAVAEKGIEQSKDALARFKLGAQDAQKALESSANTAKTVGNELTLKMIAALRADTEASFSHLEALVRAKSLSEVVELQTSFLRKQIDMGVEQVKEIQELTTKAAADVSKPVKDAFEKALRNLKAA